MDYHGFLEWVSEEFRRRNDIQSASEITDREVERMRQAWNAALEQVLGLDGHVEHTEYTQSEIEALIEDE